MITKVHDEDNKVIGFVEWRQVGVSGFDKFHGEYVFIADAWVHEDYRKTNVFSEMIEDILVKAKGAHYAYFTHRKYNDRMSRLYTRTQFENLIRKVENRWALGEKIAP